jgi:hypothetical protein
MDSELFEGEWPTLARRLEILLTRRQVPHHVCGDIVQETAIRMLERWPRLDTGRDLWPLTATIALNVLRNEARKAERRATASEPIEDEPAACTTERTVLARDDLRRVGTALSRLSVAQQRTLTSDLAQRGDAPDSASVRMMRMRARRRLHLELERVSALIGGLHSRLRWPWRRFTNSVMRDGRSLEVMVHPLIFLVLGAITVLGSLSGGGTRYLPADEPVGALAFDPDRGGVRPPPLAEQRSAVNQATSRSKQGTPAREQPTASPTASETGLLPRGTRLYGTTPGGRCSLSGCQMNQPWNEVSAAGHTVRYRTSSSVTTPSCLHDVDSGNKPSVDCSDPGGGSVEGEAEVEVDGDRRRVRAGT